MLQPRWRQYAFVAAIAGMILFANLGGARLWDRDEPRNAGCALEMLERNDWVTPVFNDELRVHKPVLQYWFMMSAYAVFGATEFAARFWSAALGVGTVLCTYLIGRRMFGDRAALWAAVVLSTSLMFNVAGRAATPDAALIFFTTLALTIYVWGAFPRHLRSDTHSAGGENQEDAEVAFAGQRPQWLPARWPTYAAMYAAMGMGVLAKGPVGLVLPTAIIGMFLLIVHRERSPIPAEAPAWKRAGISLYRVVNPKHFLATCWRMRPITALVVVLAIALPWYIWVGIRTDGQFLRGFFLDHHLGRATRVMEQHSGPFFYYPVAIMIGFFPWSVFTAALVMETIRQIRRRGPWGPGWVFALCWVGVYVGAFTVARTKLPSYVTPCYPGLALAMGALVANWTQRNESVAPIWMRLGFATYAFVGLALTIGLSVALHILTPGEEWLAIAGLLPLVVGGLCFRWTAQQRYTRAAVAFGASAVAFSLFLFALAADRVDQHRSVLALIEQLPSGDQERELASFECLEPSWVFYHRRPIEELVQRETYSRTWHVEDGQWLPKNPPVVRSYVQSRPGALIITCEDKLSRLRRILPREYQVLATASGFPNDERLVLLGQPGAGVRAANHDNDRSSRLR
jgi:4-amino-4-deoxy-L-arabinose transferase-like glycosyltransferase